MIAPLPGDWAMWIVGGCDSFTIGLVAGYVMKVIL